MKLIALIIIFFASYLLMIAGGIYLLILHLNYRTKEKKEERLKWERWQRIMNGEDILNDVFPLEGNRVEIDLLLSDEMPFNYN